MSNNWFQDMFDMAQKIHKLNKYSYQQHSDIPETVAEHLITVSGAERITDLSLGEINEYLNDLELHHLITNDLLTIVNPPKPQSNIKLEK